MYRNSNYKRSAFTTQKNSPIKSKQPSTLLHLHKSMAFYSTSKMLSENVNKIQKYQNKYQNNKNTYSLQGSALKQQTMQVMKQLQYSYFHAVFYSFEEAMMENMKLLMEKILLLQYKIADCQKKFNFVEILLAKKTKQIQATLQQNKLLIQLNRDVQKRIQQLKSKYEMSYQSRQAQRIQQKIQQFRNEINQNINTNNDIQCESCQLKIRQRLKETLVKLEMSCQNEEQQQIDNKMITNIARDTLKNLIQILYEPRQNRKYQQNKDILKEKIIQNINLKFDIMALESALREITEQQGQQQNTNKQTNSINQSEIKSQTVSQKSHKNKR